MKKYSDPEIDLICFDIDEATNFGGGDNEQPIEDFSEPGNKLGIDW
jgi:hypothetical protein